MYDMLKRFDKSLVVKPIRGSGDKFHITLKGQVMDHLGNDVKTFQDEEGFECVSLIFLGKETIKRVVDLTAIHFKFMDDLSDEEVEQVIGFYVNGDKTHTHASNVGYRFKHGRLPVKGYGGYFHIPGFLSFGLNSAGRCININTGINLEWYVQKGYGLAVGGYRTYSYRKQGKGFTISRHRSMKLVFSDYPDNCDHMVVNHLDGVPGNDDLTNLEWTCRKGNLVHAYASGLRSQNKPVLARNVFTGEVTEHYSVEECARHLGFKGQTINFRLEKCKFSSVDRNGYQYKYLDDARDWIKPIDARIAVYKAIQSIKIKVRSCSTLEITTFDSICEASKLTGVNNGTISLRLRNEDYSPCFGWQFVPMNSKFPDFTQEEVEQSLRRTNIEIDARNLLTGETRTFDSAASLSREFPITRNPLLKNKQPILPDGWQFKLSSDEWVEIENPEEAVYRSLVPVMAKDETGNIIYASSAREMENILKLDSQYVRKAALTRGEQLYHGYRFKLGTTW